MKEICYLADSLIIHGQASSMASFAVSDQWAPSEVYHVLMGLYAAAITLVLPRTPYNFQLLLVGPTVCYQVC